MALFCASVVEAPLEEFWRVIRLDLFGTFLGCRVGIPAIIEAGGGSVINIGSAITAVFGMLALNGLPMPYHPVFNVPQFESVTKDHFFIVIFSSDKNYDAAQTRKFLEELGPISVAEVPS